MHRIRVEPRSHAAVVVAEGEVDAFAAPDLDRTLSAAVSSGGALVVDLARVSFMDSTALGLVVRHVREASQAGMGTRVVLPHGSARRIFEITTLDRVLPGATTVESALAE